MKVVVVGGGLVGTAVARALAKRGVDVVVCERGVPGAEASWAAGGILSPQAECDVDGPLLRLCLAGLAQTLELCASLGDVGLRTPGTLDVASTADERQALQARVRWQQLAGLSASWLEATEIQTRFDVDAPTFGGAFFPGEASLEPRRFFEMLRASAQASGVRSVTGRRVVAVEEQRVILDEGEIKGDAVVVCAGAWTAQVPGSGVDAALLFPVRGQMAELQGQKTLDLVVYGHGGYAVPRAQGRVVVGSTMEHAGFAKAVTAGGLQKVLRTATSLLPSLVDAPVLSTWAGLRPATSDGLPLLGRSTSGAWIASGHFRNGVLLAAVSGERLAAALVDDVALDPAFAPSRRAGVKAHVGEGRPRP